MFPSDNTVRDSAVVMAVGHVWKSSVYIFLLTLFCVIAPWNLDFQSSLNLSFSRSYSLRRLEVQESTAKCLSSCSADGLVNYLVNYCLHCPTCIGNLLQQLPFANVDDIIEQDPANDNPL